VTGLKPHVERGEERDTEAEQCTCKVWWGTVLKISLP